MKKATLCTVLLFCNLFISNNLSAQEAIVHVDDVERFWIAYDSIQTTTDSMKQIDFIQRLYINKGTIGLKEFMGETGANAEKFIKMIKQDKAKLDTIRPYTLSVLEQKPLIEEKLKKMKELYADFKGGDIYFTIGINNSGGKALGKNVFIGCERVTYERKDWAVMLVLHEFVHTMHKNNNQQMLGHSIFEGMADFVAELAFGQDLAVYEPNRHTAFGLKNEKAIWEDFKSYIHFNRNSKFFGWIYGKRELNGVEMRDLGYFIGHRICKSYYDKATDKRQALKEIIDLDLNTDEQAKAFLLASGYVPKEDLEFIQNLKFSDKIPQSKNTKIYGYTLTDDSIVFKLTTNNEQTDVQKISIAGTFNAWNPKAEGFQLKNIEVRNPDKVGTEGAHYELVLPKSKLEKGKTYLFKFVINEEDWQEPPVFAQNVGFDGNYLNLSVVY